MRTVKLRGHRAAISVTLTVAAAASISCDAGTPPDGQQLSAAIASEVRRGPGTVIDLRALSAFQWSRLFVFGPYSTKADAERVLGFRWPYEWSEVEFYDDRAFLVFTDSGRVVAAFDQENDRGNFMSLFRPATHRIAPAS